MPGITGLTNVAARNVGNSYNQNSSEVTRSGRAIASGKREASEDASSYAIGQKLRTNIGVLSQASRNVSQGIAVLNVAMGGLGNIQDLVTQMKALSAKANNGTMDSASLALANTEYQALLAQVDMLAAETRWGSSSLLTGGSTSATVATFSNGFTAASMGTAAAGTYSLSSDTSGVFTLTKGGNTWTTTAVAGAQTLTLNGMSITLDATYATGTAITTTNIVLANAATQMGVQVAEQAGDVFTVSVSGASVTALGLTGTLVTTAANAAAAGALLDTALGLINTNMTSLASQQKALESASSNLSSTIDNNVAARGAVGDVNFVEESSKLASASTSVKMSMMALREMNDAQKQLADLMR